VVWLWFAPFAGLVSQTRDALGEQASSLRLRDISSDREAVGSRDGDVFVQTWATVAANNANARKVRRELEDKLSIDQLIAEWRSRGFFVGVVIAFELWSQCRCRRKFLSRHSTARFHNPCDSDAKR
jgi:hypothetical protein